MSDGCESITYVLFLGQVVSLKIRMCHTHTHPHTAAAHTYVQYFLNKFASCFISRLVIKDEGLDLLPRK